VLFIVGVVTGFVLGLTGSGGSIFAVPLLLLLTPLAINDAIGLALLAVALSALFGTLLNWRSHSILWIPAIILGCSGVLLAPLGKFIGGLLPDLLLQSAFTLLAFTIAIRMWLQAQRDPDNSKIVRANFAAENAPQKLPCHFSPSGEFEWKFRCINVLAGSGAVVGVFTGLFGVGGGFLIVPLLRQMSNASMQQAVATSLVIISAIGMSGFVSYLGLADSSAPTTYALIGAGAIVGMTAGYLSSRKLAGAAAQKVFSLALVVVSSIALFTKQLG